MVQIAMLITGVVSGLKARSWQQVVRLTLLVLVVTLAVQTVIILIVTNDLDSTKDHLVYWPLQVVSFLVALAIARWLMRRRPSPSV